MQIEQIKSIIPDILPKSETQKNGGAGFQNVFTSFIKDVSDAQNESKQLTEDFALGKDVELHEVMIAGEKASTSLDLLMEIRNKTIDMYKELTKMQV
ncbi:MAG TPA: flagellar hook-basal body complex protein FliE [Ignavibacteriales bacterium]|nr:flagellar hook-basal body complex protein FliE [Ignavibacteriales bacterium]